MVSFHLKPHIFGQKKFMVSDFFLRYSVLWNLIGCTLCVLSMKTIGSDSFFECVFHMEWPHVVVWRFYPRAMQGLALKIFLILGEIIKDFPKYKKIALTYNCFKPFLVTLQRNILGINVCINIFESITNALWI